MRRRSNPGPNVPQLTAAEMHAYYIAIVTASKLVLVRSAIAAKPV